MINKIKTSTVTIPVFLFSSLLLSACGGGSSVTQAPLSNPQTSQPTQVESADWQNSDVLARRQTGNMQISVDGSQLHVAVNNMWRKRSGKHIQIFLDIDNNPATGYQSRYSLWSQSGIDYLIQDGHLYKARTNSSRWSWKRLDTDVNYQHHGKNISFDISSTELDGLCNSFTAGYMSRHKNWFIQSIYPVSRKLKSYQVNSCANTQDNIAPKITLNGANPMTLALNATFNDPGATASDNVDGDISTSIETTSTVNTAIPGRYSVTYKVTDSSGNTTHETRVVIVSEASTPDGIIIDGNADDWAAIAPLAQTAKGKMKVFDDETKLYILVEANQVGANTQIFIDSDNYSHTGFRLSTQSWAEGGADYMIENNSLGKAIGNTAQWAWNFDLPATVESVRTSNVLEIAIKKSDLQPLNHKFSIGFMSRNTDWNINYVLPDNRLLNYQQQQTDSSNLAPIALDDSITLSAGKRIPVLENDSDSDGDFLRIISVTPAQNGRTDVAAENTAGYVPNAGFTGTDSFTYTISDGHGHTATATVNVTVVSNNQAPVAVNDTASATAGTRLVINVLNNDSDPDSDPLTITTVSPAQNGTAVIAGSTINYTANANFSGTDTFSYTISDGRNGTSSATVTITVTPPAINHAPDAVEDAPSTNHTQAITIKVLDNDTDPDGDNLTVTSITQPTFGTAILNADGTVLFDPQGNIGSITFSYTISDGRGGTDSTVVTIASSDPNDGNNSFPDIVNDNVTTPVNTPITIDVLANDSDADGDTLVLDQVDGGSHGITTKVNGKVLYTPEAGFTGTDTFYYGVHDGHGHNGSGLVTVKVGNVPL